MEPGQRRSKKPENVETRGGEKIDWSHVVPGEPLPELPEPETSQVYDKPEMENSE
jgi:hypothetical protein